MIKLHICSTLMAANNASFSFRSFFALTFAFLASLSASLYNKNTFIQELHNSFLKDRQYNHNRTFKWGMKQLQSPFNHNNIVIYMLQ